MAKSRLRFVPALAWTIVILKLLLSESDGIPPFWWLDFPHSDKIIHAVLFGVNAFLVAFALNGKIAHPQPRKLVAWVMLWTLILGLSTELGQHYFLVTRRGDMLDLLADLAGGSVSVVWLLFQTKKLEN